MFISSALKPTDGEKSSSILKDDRVWGGFVVGRLCGVYVVLLQVNQALGQAQKSGEQFFHSSQSGGNDFQRILLPKLSIEQFEADCFVVTNLFEHADLCF